MNTFRFCLCLTGLAVLVAINAAKNSKSSRALLRSATNAIPAFPLYSRTNDPAALSLDRRESGRPADGLREGLAARVKAPTGPAKAVWPRNRDASSPFGDAAV